MISICLTNYNREQLLYESIEQVIDDERISEIVISDDCSEYGLYCRVVDHYKAYPKVKIYRNEKNLDCYGNKRQAISLASNEWVIIFDSDNILTKEYIDALFFHKRFGTSEISNGYNWLKNQVYQPVAAKPNFQCRRFENALFSKSNLEVAVLDSNFLTMMNAMNYFVNRDEYLRVWDADVDPVTSDSIYQNYRWLEAGNKIYITPRLEYEHRVNKHSSEEGSHYMKNHRRTKPGFHESIVNKLKAMR